MGWIALVVILVILGLPVAWLASEWKSSSKALRCTLGILSILCFWGIAFLAVQPIRLNYNAWYSVASRELLVAVVEKLEMGETEMVLDELKAMLEKFHAGYESENYDVLARAAAERIRSGHSAGKANRLDNTHIPNNPVPMVE